MAITSVYKEMRGTVHLRDLEVDEVCEKMESFEFYMRESGAYLFYAYVLHNADLDEKGKAETPHIQFYCRQRDKKRVQTVINEIAVAMGVNTLAVSIRKGKSKDLGIRYLVHADDSEKFQYPKDQLHHNLPQEYIDLLLSENWENDEKGIGFNEVYDVVLESNGSCAYIVQKLGLETYMHYRWAIMDIKKEMFGESYKRYSKPPSDKKAAVN